MSPTTLAQRRFAARNSNTVANMKAYRSALCKTFKSVAETIAHALDENDGELDGDGRYAGVIVKDYPELNYRYVSRRTSDASAGTLVVNNYERQLALPLGKLEVHRAPPTPVRRRCVDGTAGSNDSAAGAARSTAAGIVGRVTPRKELVGKENRKSVVFAHPAVRNVSGEESGQTRPVTIMLPSANRERPERKVDDGDGDDGAAAALAVKRPKLSPYPWTPRSVTSETTASTRMFSETSRSSDRASSLLSGSINSFKRGSLLRSRQSSTVRRLQVRHVSPMVDLTGKSADDEDVATQPGLPRITVTQASTRRCDVAKLKLRPNSSTDSSASSIEVPRVLRPKRVKARLVTIPPTSRVTSTAAGDVEYGRRWRDSDAIAGVQQATVDEVAEEHRASRREASYVNTPNYNENDKPKDRMSLYRPYHPRDSWSTNIDKYNSAVGAYTSSTGPPPVSYSASSRPYSRTSSQVSAEQNRQLIDSLGISSKAYNKLLAALERGSFLSDNDDEEEDENEKMVEVGVPSEARVPTRSPPPIPVQNTSRPVRIPTSLRPHHSKNPPPVNSTPARKVNFRTDPADDVFVGKGLSAILARQQQLQKLMVHREREYRNAIQKLSKSNSNSPPKFSSASSDTSGGSTVLKARLAAMSGSGDCFHAMMSAGDAARGRRGKGRCSGRD